MLMANKDECYEIKSNSWKIQKCSNLFYESKRNDQILYLMETNFIANLYFDFSKYHQFQKDKWEKITIFPMFCMIF